MANYLTYVSSENQCVWFDKRFVMCQKFAILSVGWFLMESSLVCEASLDLDVHINLHVRTSGPCICCGLHLRLYIFHSGPHIWTS